MHYDSLEVKLIIFLTFAMEGLLLEIFLIFLVVLEGLHVLHSKELP